MSEKCCNRVGVQSTHWEGCHEVHPSCAAFKAGREAGLREAAGIANQHGSIEGVAQKIESAILAAIWEGK